MLRLPPNEIDPLVIFEFLMALAILAAIVGISLHLL